MSDLTQFRDRVREIHEAFMSQLQDITNTANTSMAAAIDDFIGDGALVSPRYVEQASPSRKDY